MDALLQRIYQQYPAIADHPYSVVDSRGKPSKFGGSIEFFSPDEPDNPKPGRATVEVYSQDLKGDALDKAVFGDMLHYLPQVDPVFNEQRQAYRKLITPEQAAIDRGAYDRAKAEYGEDRPFDDWMDISRLDAHLRGYLAPDANDEWAGSYTPEQISVLDGIRSYLQTPKVPVADGASPALRRVANTLEQM